MSRCPAHGNRIQQTPSGAVNLIGATPQPDCRRTGRKRCYDNILVEHLWRTNKYVAAGFSAVPSRGVSTCLQRWPGGWDQHGPFCLELLPCKAS